MSEIPTAEQRMSPEQVVAQLTAGAEAVFAAHNLPSLEPRQRRSVRAPVGTLTLSEYLSDQGDSSYTCWSATSGTEGITERTYGEWKAGATEVIADTKPFTPDMEKREQAPLGADGLAALKKKIETSFPAPEKPAVERQRHWLKRAALSALGAVGVKGRG